MASCPAWEATLPHLSLSSGPQVFLLKVFSLPWALALLTQPRDMPSACFLSSPAPTPGEGGRNNAEGQGRGQQGLGNSQAHGGSGGPSFCLLTLSCGPRRKRAIPACVSSLAEF